MSREKRNKVLEIICLISEFVLKYGKLTNQTYLYIKRHNVLENLNKNYNMKQRIFTSEILLLRKCLVDIGGKNGSSE